MEHPEKDGDIVRHSGENRRSPLVGRYELTTHIKQMDEDQKAVEQKDFTWKIIPFTKGDEDSEKAAKKEAVEYKAEMESSTGKRYSDVGHTDNNYYVAYSRIGEITALALEESATHFNMRSPITGGYMIGRSWAECH